MSPFVRGLFGLVLVVLCAGRGRASNLVANPGFETGAGGPTHVTLVGVTSPSAAADWGSVQNYPGTTDTSLVASTDPFAPGGNFMIQVLTTGLDNGIEQYPVQMFTFVSADVYVSSGTVRLIASPDFGTTSTSVATSGTGWQHLVLTSPGANEIAIYSYDPNGATYAVDNVVATVPEPASWVVLGTAVLGLGLVAQAQRARRAGLPGSGGWPVRGRRRRPAVLGG